MPNLETWSSADGDGVVATLDTLGNMAVASLSVAGSPLPAFGSIAEKPVLADGTVFVTKASSASDSNDGLSMGSAKATIAGALAALGTRPGVIQLGYGTWYISSADTYGNAITLPHGGSCLRGLGMDLTVISVSCAVTWGIQCMEGLSEVHDLTLQGFTGGSLTYGVGVDTLTAVGSAEGCKFYNLQAWPNSGTMANAYAVGPTHTGVGSVDIAETYFHNCTGSGSNAAWILGNGTGGNILNTYMYGCDGSVSTYGILCNDTIFHWIGGTLQHNSYDIYVTGLANGNSSAEKFRSETSGVLLYGTAFGGNSTFTLKDVMWTSTSATIPASGIILSWSAAGCLTIDDTIIQVSGITPLFVIGGNAAVIARNIQAPVPYTQLFSIAAAQTACVILEGYIQLDPSTGYTLAGTGPFPGPVLLQGTSTSVNFNGTNRDIAQPVSILTSGIASAIPAAAMTNYGQWYFATDTSSLSYSNGIAWSSVTLTAAATPSNDPLSLGFTSTYLRNTGSSASTFGNGAMSGEYAKLVAGGYTISQLTINVVTAYGNVSAAVFAGTGSGVSQSPGTLMATTSGIPCPAAGVATMNFGSTPSTSATPGLAGWAAMSCDNITASFSILSQFNTSMSAATAGTTSPRSDLGSSANGTTTVADTHAASGDLGRGVSVKAPRSDTLCTVTSGVNTIIDSHAVATDIGATIFNATTPGNIPAGTTITGITSSPVGYTISANAVSGAGTATQTLIIGPTGPNPARTDALCTFTTTTAVTDPSAAAGDIGAVITDVTNPTYIPAGTYIIGVSGTTYTLSQATTHANSGSGDTLLVGNQVIPPNTVISTVNAGTGYILSNPAALTAAGLTFLVGQHPLVTSPSLSTGYCQIPIMKGS